MSSENTGYTPSGWGGPIVPSSVTGTNVVNTLYGGQPTYIDLAIANEGPDDITETFFMDLLVDGVVVASWYGDGLPAGYYAYVEDWVADPVIQAGQHTLKLVGDSEDDVSESDELDNEHEETFTWVSGGTTTTTAITTTTSIPTTTTTTKWARKFYEIILGEGSQEKLSSLRNFRDEVLLFNLAGKRYVELLYNHSEEIASLLSEDPELRSHTAEVVGKMLPVMRAALNGREMVISKELIYKIISLLGEFEVEASPDLKATIKDVKRAIRGGGVLRQLKIAVE